MARVGGIARSLEGSAAIPSLSLVQQGHQRPMLWVMLTRITFVTIGYTEARRAAMVRGPDRPVLLANPLVGAAPTRPL